MLCNTAFQKWHLGDNLLKVVKLLYSEIKHFDWMLQVMWKVLANYYLTFVYEIASWIHNFSLIGVLAVTNHSVNTTTLHYKLQNDIQSASGQTQFKVLGHNQCDQIWWPIWRIWKVFGHFSGLLMTWQVF